MKEVLFNSGNKFILFHYLDEITNLKQMLSMRTYSKNYKDIIKLLKRNIACYINFKEFTIDKWVKK